MDIMSQIKIFIILSGIALVGAEIASIYIKDSIRKKKEKNDKK